MYMAHATIKNEEGRILKEVSGFEWDKGNKIKNLTKHKVSQDECEETFFDYNRKVQKDLLHSRDEERYILLGQTKYKRLLYIIFTIRKEKVRVISARDINKKERKLYEEKT
ncbi:hypothetical protein A2814_01555 [Candidatus Nomurabacteria bacterium RIFCSPHIGHO2_01_FULL_38_19]|uniref:BrnT family toxin n=1 Tax=Candidatus Nomurabacteria bacterium RIFCSPHIGHO2_01_FULL_38_19 TaxID=1801732 RepID=A0A1F6URN9_9BACT|nr:MAG: hypothetical protein A2814_01555 [Candidatus Nomurabacteria bacterium RIFCSPHIGHO2_01_FULL_38_19]